MSSDRECFIAWWSSSCCGLLSTSPHTLQGNRSPRAANDLDSCLVASGEQGTSGVTLSDCGDIGDRNGDAHGEDGVDSSTDV